MANTGGRTSSKARNDWRGPCHWSCPADWRELCLELSHDVCRDICREGCRELSHDVCRELYRGPSYSPVTPR